MDMDQETSWGGLLAFPALMIVVAYSGGCAPRYTYETKVEDANVEVAFYDYDYINSLPQSIKKNGNLYKYSNNGYCYYRLNINGSMNIDFQEKDIKSASSGGAGDYVANVNEFIEEHKVTVFKASVNWPVVAVRTSDDDILYQWELWDYDLFEAYHRQKEKAIEVSKRQVLDAAIEREMKLLQNRLEQSAKSKDSDSIEIEGNF